MVKKALKNSIYWHNVYNFLFSKKLIDAGADAFKFTSLTNYNEFASNVRYYGEIIKSMDQLTLKEEFTVSVNLRSEVRK